MIPRIVSFGMTHGGLSSSCMRQLESQLDNRDTVHVLISDESSAENMARRFINKFGVERLDQVRGIVHFIGAYECGHVFGAIKQMVDAFADKEINIYLDAPSLTAIRAAGEDAQVVLTDKMQSIELDRLLDQNPNVVVRVACLRMSAHQMVDFARATGTLSK